MTISNHMLAGAAIALVVKQPILVLPLAFASHFVLDAVPHFGYPGGEGFAGVFRHKLSYAEAAYSVVSFMVLLATVGLWTWLTALAAVLAFAPDFHWISRYLIYERRGLEPPPSRFGQFHSWIQWCERPWGIIVEVVTFVIGYLLVRRYLI